MTTWDVSRLVSGNPSHLASCSGAGRLWLMLIRSAYAGHARQRETAVTRSVTCPVSATDRHRRPTRPAAHNNLSERRRRSHQPSSQSPRPADTTRRPQAILVRPILVKAATAAHGRLASRPAALGLPLAARVVSHTVVRNTPTVDRGVDWMPENSQHGQCCLCVRGWRQCSSGACGTGTYLW